VYHPRFRAWQNYILAVLLLILVFPAASSAAGTKVSLQLQWKHQFEFAGFYAAKELGYYRDAGLDVEIREYKRGIDIPDEVLSGKATFGTLYSTIILKRMQGARVVLLANYFKRSPLALVTKPDIYSPSQLRGKKVMGVKHELESANFAQVFNQFEMTAQDIDIVPHVFNTKPFERGEVDATTVFMTNEVYWLRKRNVPFNIIDPNNFGVPFYDVNVFTSEDYANNNPEVAEAFIKASNKGWEYALNHQEEIVDLILEKYNTQGKTRGHLLFEAAESERLIMPTVYPIGSVDVKRIQLMEALFHLVNMADLVDPSLFVFGEWGKPSIPLTETEQLFVEKAPPVKVIQSFHQPPFIVTTDNKHTGYLYDLLREVLRIAGLKMEYVPGGKTFDSMIETVRQGKADILPNMSTSGKLTGPISRTQPIATAPYALVGKITSDPINTLADLHGKRVAVVKGYAQDRLLDNFPKIHKIHVANNEEAFNAVRMGYADYFLNNLANSNYILQNTYATDLRISGELPYTEFPPLSLAFAISQRESELYPIFKKALDAVPLETILRLRRKWFGEEGLQAAGRNTDEKTLLVDFRVRPPHMSIQGDSAVGPLIDLLEKAVENIGYKIKWQFRPFEESLEALKSGQSDIVPRIFLEKDREEFASFIGPIGHETKKVEFLMRPGGKSLERYEDLQGLTIAVKEKGSYFKRFEDDETLKKVVAENEHEQIRLFKEGKADVVVFYEGHLIADAIKAMELTEYEIAPLTHEGAIDVYYALSRRSPFNFLAKPLQKEMAHLREDGEIEKAYAQSSIPVVEGGTGKIPTIELTEEERDYLKAFPTLRVAFDIDWPPMESASAEGNMQGISADYLGKIGEMLGVRFVPSKPQSWTKMLVDVKNGDLDLLSAVSDTADRRQWLGFTKPYMSFPLVIVTSKEVPYVGSLEDLGNSAVAVVNGYASQELLRSNHPDLILLPTDSVRAGLMAVLDGEAAAFVGSLATVSHVMSREGISGLKVSGETPYAYDISMAARKADTVLLGLLQKGIDALGQKERDAINSKWMNITYEHTMDYTLLWKVLGGTACILIVILYWNRRLKTMTEELQIAKDDAERANIRLECVAKQDGLTQLANRRCFDEALEKEWARAIRDNLAISLVMCDVDYFKPFNDIYGHVDGDDCLRKIAETLKYIISRPADLAARYGGEEFVLLLPNTDEAGALALAEKTRQGVLELGIQHEKNVKHGKIISMSFGVTTLLPAKGQQPEDLVTIADKALYQAKENGRNRVEVAMLGNDT